MRCETEDFAFFGVKRSIWLILVGVGDSLQKSVLFFILNGLGEADSYIFQNQIIAWSEVGPPGVYLGDGVWEGGVGKGVGKPGEQVGILCQMDRVDVGS